MTIETHADKIKKRQAEKRHISAYRLYDELMEDPEWTDGDRVRIKEAMHLVEKNFVNERQ